MRAWGAIRPNRFLSVAAWFEDDAAAESTFRVRPPNVVLIRRKSFAMTPCTVDEATLEMDLLDYDFHLFNEKGTGIAGVLYRSGPTGYRLALVAPTSPGSSWHPSKYR